MHLWLGLASGLVVLIVSITGCLFVFQKEISEWIWKEKYFVKPTGGPVLPLHVLERKAQAALGAQQRVQTIVTYEDPGRTWEFMTYRENDTALTYFGVLEYYRSAFVNPYTGEVTGIRDFKYDFFYVVKYLHWSLLLNTAYGQPIVGWSTLIFVVLLITGLVLWWPKRWTKAYRERSFKIKWKARWRRVNYDLHNVAGFYSLFPALIIALTGMVYSFQWFSKLVYIAAAGTTRQPAAAVVKPAPPSGEEKLNETGLDRAWAAARRELPEGRRFMLSPAADSNSTIYVYGYKDQEVYYGADTWQFDPYSGRLLHKRLDKEKNAGERLIEKNFDIHVGAIGGLTGKIIAFIASLICASLPVTGFLVWWGKRRKSVLL